MVGQTNAVAPTSIRGILSSFTHSQKHKSVVLCVCLPINLTVCYIFFTNIYTVCLHRLVEKNPHMEKRCIVIVWVLQRGKNPGVLRFFLTLVWTQTLHILMLLSEG